MTWSLLKIRQYLFYLLIFIIPWQTRWIIRDAYLSGEVWEYGRISLYPWDVLLALLVIISLPIIWWAIKNIKVQNSNAKSNSIESLALTPPWLGGGQDNQKPKVSGITVFLFLLLLAFVSIIWSGNKLLAFTWSLRLFEAGLLWLLIIALKPRWVLVCWSLVAAGAFQAGWAIWQFLTQSSFANKWLGVAVHPLTQGGTSVVMNEYGRWLRAYAGQVHPNVLGGFLVITLLATTYLYFVHKSKIINTKSDSYSILLLLLYILQLVGLFFTFSRGAWLALFFSIIFWWWRERENRQVVTQVIITSAITIAVLGGIYWQPLSGRFTGASTLEQQSIDDRRGSIKESGGILSTKWILGTGIGNYTAELSQNTPNLKAWRYQPVHNIFLLVFTELGVIGHILLIIILWKSIRPFWLRNSLFIIPILFTAQFDHYWWTAPSMFLLFWLILFFRDIEKLST